MTENVNPERGRFASRTFPMRPISIHVMHPVRPIAYSNELNDALRLQASFHPARGNARILLTSRELLRAVKLFLGFDVTPIES